MPRLIVCRLLTHASDAAHPHPATGGVRPFAPYLGSLSGVVISTCVAIAQFWPHWAVIWIVPAIFFVGQTLSYYLLSPISSAGALTCTRSGSCLRCSHSATCSGSSAF